MSLVCITLMWSPSGSNQTQKAQGRINITGGVGGESNNTKEAKEKVSVKPCHKQKTKQTKTKCAGPKVVSGG